MSTRDQPLVVGLGESLFDCFDQRQVLGGAPLNVVIHTNVLLSRGKGAAVPATRVGADALGDQVVEALEARGIATHGVQRDPSKPTGRVQVTLDDQGVATYAFESDSAWDALEWTEGLKQMAERSSAVAFGTLAQRSEVSRNTICTFLETATDAVRLFDVNLRQDYYSPKILADSLRLATAVKVNEEELETLTSLLAEEADASKTLPEAADWLRSRFNLDWVAVTRGPLGAAISNSDGWHEGGQQPPLTDLEDNADTVGAGDACCAGLLTGTLLGWSTERTLALANATGSYVASRSGATPQLPDEILALVHPS